MSIWSHWQKEPGPRLQGSRPLDSSKLQAPCIVRNPSGGYRLFYTAVGPGKPFGPCQGYLLSAVSDDGLRFRTEPGIRVAEVVAPARAGEPWAIFYSAWQDAPPGSVVPVHPSQDPDAVDNGLSADFAAASIAADMAGFRSRIFVASSTDGLDWGRGACVIEGTGYDGDGIDAVHAEDMSLIQIGGGRYRMYYAACDAHGNWRIASAVTADPE